MLHRILLINDRDCAEMGLLVNTKDELEQENKMLRKSLVAANALLAQALPEMPARMLDWHRRVKAHLATQPRMDPV